MSFSRAAVSAAPEDRSTEELDRPYQLWTANKSFLVYRTGCQSGSLTTSMSTLKRSRSSPHDLTASPIARTGQLFWGLYCESDGRENGDACWTLHWMVLND